MTADPTTYPETLDLNSASSRRLDPVRARVTAGQQITYAQSLPSATFLPEAHAEHRGLHLPADTRGLHPGDVLYWVACLAGVCLLLLAAIT
jgi:hypothetical protein